MIDGEDEHFQSHDTDYGFPDSPFFLVDPVAEQHSDGDELLEMYKKYMAPFPPYFWW